MRTILADNPIFVASSKTLDFSAITGFNIKNLLAINNLTRKVLIYAISTNGYAGSWNELNKTLTLDYDTTTFANDDLLVCYYDINSVSIDNFPLNQVVTVDGINLLATEVTNLDIKNLLNSLDNKDFATETTLSNINTKLTTIDNSVNSLLKPSNTLNKINTIDTITNTVTVDGSLNINNFPSNQTVNGTIIANIGTTNGLALDSSISTVNSSINALLKPADTLNKVNTIDTITNTVTVQGDVNASISNLNTLATETTLVSVLQAIVNNRAFQETIWTDNNSGTLTFFLRRTIYNPLTDTLETENILPNGTPYTPTGIQSVTTANKDFELRNIEYKAVNSDTGYTAGDFISRTDIMDLTSNPATVTSTIWFNVSTNTNLISIPNSNDILLLESLEAQETTQLLIKTNTDDIKTKIDTSNSLLNDIKSNTSSSISNYALETGGKLASLDTNIGAKSDTVASDDTGTFSLIAMIKKVAQNITTLKNIFTTTINGLKVDGSAVTQPISGSVSVSNFPVSQTINGTVTANIGTTNGLALDSSLTSSNTKLDIVNSNLTTLNAKDFATQTTLALIKAKTDNLDTTLSTLNTSINTHLKPADTLTKVSTVDTITNTVKVDGTATIQPVSARKIYIPNLASNFDLATEVSDNDTYAMQYVGLSGRSTVRALTPSSFTASSGIRGAIQGYGASGSNISFYITCTALSGGTSPSVDLILCESLDGGTTFKDIYHIERISAVNTSNPIHLTNIPVTGILYFRWVTNGTPSTANITIQYSFGSASVTKKVRYFDRTSALLAGTLNVTSSTYSIAGCSKINVSAYFTAVSNPAIYSIQVSDDATNWQTKTTITPIVGVTDITLTNIMHNYVRILCSTGVITSQTAVYFCIKGQESADGIINANGQNTMANSQSVTIASNQSNVPTIFNLGNSDAQTKLSSNGFYLLGTLKYSIFVPQNIFPTTSNPNGGVTATNYHCTSLGYTIIPSSITATAGYKVHIVLMESNNNGNNYRPIWYSDTITASNITSLATTGIIVPSLPVRGSHRQWQLVTNSGITVTASQFSIQALESSREEVVRYKFVDYTVNLLNGILNATSSSYNISSATQINVRINCGTITGGVGAVYQIQVSDNNVDFCNVGTTFQAIASNIVHSQISGVVATYVRVICITATTGTQTGNEN